MKFIDVHTKLGTIRGEDMGGYQVFRSVAYAEPPIDQLRFKRPVEKQPWNGVLDATLFKTRPVQVLPQQYGGDDGLYCVEFYNRYDFIPQRSEDCLHLNIWTPNINSTEKFPVAFWIHGGGFGSGFGFEKEFDGEAYCKRGVILVTINYRVGFMGFLAHPWLIAEDSQGLCGNYGIFDQITALKWVYENIESFGGDKNNITIFGQSAGAGSVHTLVSTDLTSSMINKAILQSGIMNNVMRSNAMEDALASGVQYVEMTGAKNLTELREMSWEYLLEVFLKYCAVVGIQNVAFMGPVIDGYLLKQPLQETTKLCQMHPIPYLVGSNKDDIFVLKEGGKSVLYDACIEWCETTNTNGFPDAYLYYFSRNLPGDNNGAFHSAELWYMFGTLGRCWRPMEEHDYQLSGDMLNYWTNFMKTGHAGWSNGVEWPSYPYMKEFN